MPRHAADRSSSPEPPTDPQLPIHEAGGTEAPARVVSPRTVRLTAYVVGLALLIGGAAAVTFGHHDSASNSASDAAAARSDERASRGDLRTSADPLTSTTPTAAAGVALGSSPTPTAVPPAPAPVVTKAPPPPMATKTPAKAAVAPPPAVSAGCSSYSGSRLIACNLLPSFGFATSEMAALDPMWNNESGWNASAENPSSGAYGIPQALPGSKMAIAGDDWRTNPATQIKWGLDYIKGRYGSPSAAWSFWQSNGWY